MNNAIAQYNNELTATANEIRTQEYDIGVAQGKLNQLSRIMGAL